MSFDDPSGLGMNRAATMAARVVRHGDLAAYLSVMEDYIAAANQPWPAALDDTEQVSSEVKSRVGRFHIQTKLLMPALDAATGALARGTANCRVTALAIALERYRKANGKPPATLEELAPKYIKEVPLDPYTGKAFTYRVDDAGYVVYSMGGIKNPQNTDAETGALDSLLFRWPAMPKPTPAVDAQDAAPTGEP